ncbi:hypothetical protein SCLCIDRAFT_1212819 [Scleroderma citrinum Foug A]|uniref:Uncharacterized protein n=1 Tax=Scleroderma citrinum Foug A TaxID=1036808 RepID=A0A0C3E9U6_9AGAM|nr:hypothetical protein SCLCIDRAFT_1212819 [Scleroderma citrinum Foug A]
MIILDGGELFFWDTIPELLDEFIMNHRHRSPQGLGKDTASPVFRIEWNEEGKRIGKSKARLVTKGCSQVQSRL